MLKKIIISTLLFVGLMVPVFVASPSASASLFDSAKQDACGGAQLKDGTGNCASVNTNSLDNTVAQVLNILSVIIAVVAVVVIIINGLRFVTSGGDASKVSSAKNGILFAIVGLAVVAMAQFIVKFVINRVG